MGKTRIVTIQMMFGVILTGTEEDEGKRRRNELVDSDKEIVSRKSLYVILKLLRLLLYGTFLTLDKDTIKFQILKEGFGLKALTRIS